MTGRSIDSAAAAGPAVVATAPGKVNLHLRVGAPRPDGYHPVASLYAAVDLLETVEAVLDPSLPAGRITCRLEVVAGSLVAQQQAIGAFEPSHVPLDERNLAVRAARAVLAEAPELPGGLRLLIRKAVPVAGGMGGGSADAAAALEAAAGLVRRATGVEISRPRLLEIGAQLGADVPFALTGGAAVGLGAGEQLTAVPMAARWPVVLIADAGALSTPAVFRALDEMRAQSALAAPLDDELAVPASLLQALADGDPEAGAAWLANDLQEPAMRMAPELRTRLARLEAEGAAALVSGSGPTILALPGDAARAASLAARLRAEGACAIAASAG